MRRSPHRRVRRRSGARGVAGDRGQMRHQVRAGRKPVLRSRRTSLQAADIAAEAAGGWYPCSRRFGPASRLSASRSTAATCHSASRRVRSEWREGAAIRQRSSSRRFGSVRAAKSATDRNGRAARACLDPASGILAQAGGVFEPEPQLMITFNCAFGAVACDPWPSGAMLSIEQFQLDWVTSIGSTVNDVALRVLHQGRRMIEAQRIAIEHRGEKRGRMMAFQISGGVGDQREAGGVRLRESHTARTR